MMESDLVIHVEGDYVAQLNYIQLEDRQISHDYLITESGEVKVRVNGSLLDDLVTEPLFRNTFSTFKQTT